MARLSGIAHHYPKNGTVAHGSTQRQIVVVTKKQQCMWHYFDQMSAKSPNGMPSGNRFSYNVVKSDGRLKEVIYLEKQTRRQWEKRWGFSRNLMKMYHDSVKAEGIYLRKGQLHPMLDSGKDLKVSPSPSVPITSSGFIGWRSSVNACLLERLGQFYVSPRLTIEPPDSPNFKQIHIFIG